MSESHPFSSPKRPPSLPTLETEPNYIDSVLWNQSSSTWMHSTPVHSIPKARRFHTGSVSAQIDTINLPSTLSARTTSLGYSQKEFIPESQLNNAKNIPSPSTYHLKTSVDENKQFRKGKTFGLSFSYYQRTYTPEMKHIPHPSFFRENPGPGNYQIIKEPGFSKLKYSMLGKGKTFSQLQKNDIPASNAYEPKKFLTEANRFSRTSFGFGWKLDLAKPANYYPGPGTYKLPSVFDKCKRKKKRDNF